MPNPGNRNFPIIVAAPPVGEDVEERTFLAKRNVMELTTVSISWDHHENHDDARSATEARYISGSISEEEDDDGDDEDDDN